MSALKRRSSVALIIGIAIMLLLIPIWYVMLVPSIIISELEKLDLTTSYEGTLEHPLYGLIPVLIKAHAYAEGAKGDNIIMKMDINTTTFGDMKVHELSANLTYVFNKFTRENVENAPEADKPREGYDYIYPSHLKTGEDISKAWLDNLKTTGTLEFKGSVREEGVTLYKYFVNKTIIVPDYYLGSSFGYANCSLMSTKTILIEPRSGLWTYTENETFSLIVNFVPPEELVYLTYKSTAESKTERLADAKTIYGNIQLLELYIPTIFGVIAIVLTIALAFNVRRLERKKLPKPEKPSAFA